jgi:pimeloyl-ACP methyl ester carboxylesterase
MREWLVGALLRAVVPLRLINGAADINSGGHMAERLRTLMPSVDIVSLERHGHWRQIEAPANVVRAVLAFAPQTRALNDRSACPR